MREVKTITTDFLDYLQKRDLPNILNLFAENVKWEIPGNLENIKWLGKRNNKQEIEEFFKFLWKETEPVSGEIHRVLYDNSEAVIKGCFTTKILETQKVVNSIFFIHLMVYNGEIVEYTLLEDSYAVSESFK